MILARLKELIEKPFLLGKQIDFDNSRNVIIQIQVPNKPEDPQEDGEFLFPRFEYHELTDAGVLFHRGEFKFCLASYKE